MSRLLTFTFLAGASLLALALAACHSTRPIHSGIHSGRVLPGQTIAEDYRPATPSSKAPTFPATEPDAITRSQPVPSVPIKYPETP